MNTFHPTPTPEEALTKYAGLVKMFVRKWTCNHRTLRDHREDLIQDGNEGLLRALKTYDPTRGSFSTYAHYWVSIYVKKGAARTVGLTSRPSAGKAGGQAAFRTDHTETDAEGMPLTSETVASSEPSPEQAVINRDLAKKLSRRLRGRDGDIYARRLQAEESYGGGLFRGKRGDLAHNSGAAIGADLGLSRERVRQIIQEQEELVRSWGRRVEREAA